MAALVPLVFVLPMRYAAFADASPWTLVLLGPATEECVKMAGILSVLALLAAMGPWDPRRGAAAWRFAAVPWIVGASYGLFESVFAYPGEPWPNLLERMAGHGAFVAAGLTVALWAWRNGLQPLPGLWFGLSAALACHDAFNVVGLLRAVTGSEAFHQGVFLYLLIGLVLWAAYRGVPAEPRSDPARQLLGIPGLRGERA